MNDLTTAQLRRLLTIQTKIEKLQGEKRRIIGGTPAPNPAKSEVARRKISAAVTARWAQRKAEGKKRL